MNQDTRLTEKTIGCFEYDLKEFKHEPHEFNDYDAFFAYSMAVRRLGELEDKLENGLLVELPCKIGETVYIIGRKYRHGSYDSWINTGKFKFSDMEKLNTTIFLTRFEAEAELERRKSNE